jgi:hypothetical protein
VTIDEKFGSVPRGTTRSFRQPPMFRRLAWFGIILSAPACPLSLVLPYVLPGSVNWPTAIFSFVMFAAGLLAGVAFVRRTGDTITLDDAGIRCDSPRAPVVFIPWNEVADVETQNVMQRIAVRDASRGREILAEFHLQGFGTLRRTVLERTGRKGGRG